MKWDGAECSEVIAAIRLPSLVRPSDVYGVEPPPVDYPPETWPDYAAPIIVSTSHSERQSLVGTFGMVPKSRIPSGMAKFDTTNARSETVGEKRSFSGPWKKRQLCLVPATGEIPSYGNPKLSLLPRALRP
ncbi:SOS response-associated peptidase family protein [Cupriavidus sp. CuC1]|uniref:SOS response-associated peptidase family protein n=1 Tax=Cupriavidus sp. CuC1 TaxID=3373131 RepID=UPI0037D545F0